MAKDETDRRREKEKKIKMEENKVTYNNITGAALNTISQLAKINKRGIQLNLNGDKVG